MTKKIFWENSYLTELETFIETVQDELVTVRETIFYAFSGGQESDRGTIGGYAVLSAKKDGKQIYYQLPNQHGLIAGDAVHMTIDWERRYRLMRLHFAAELVLELVCRRFPDVVKVGAHIAEDKARIDFQWQETISPFIVLLQEEAQEIIDANEMILSAFSDEPNERRYWKIETFAEVPCGGTHIRRTSEVGRIRLKRHNPGKNKERIEIYVS
ncbi:alanyl-tRNA editing protein [Legionella yabuuchiae]|uniref:alanyl-tRNA editing protein n=1 Tax=Legionella yabuuchiae TaxID=376727 RepID=UPI0010546806|nr:alanyl-tRNA editing protein [Legionella yabuuchiae]